MTDKVVEHENESNELDTGEFEGGYYDNGDYRANNTQTSGMTEDRDTSSGQRRNSQVKREDVFADGKKSNPIDGPLDQADNLLQGDGYGNNDAGDLDIRPGQFAMSPNADLRKGWSARTFSRLNKGSLRGSIFALCASAIGSGVLTLPSVFGLCGWGAGIFFLCLASVGAEISLRMLAHLAVANKMPNYSSICIAAGGQKLNVLLSVQILLFMGGACISYQIMVTSMFKYVMKCFGVSNDYVESIEFTLFQSIPTALFLLLPTSAMRDMSAFRYASLGSIAALLYTGVVLIIELPQYYKEFKPTARVVAFDFNVDLLTGMATTFFAFQCQVQMLPIYSELVNPVYRRVVKVIDRAIAVDLSFYATIAIAGYLSSFDQTRPIVLERDRIGPNVDVAILIAILLVIGSILVAFPVAFNPFRQQFFVLFKGRNTFSDKENWTLTTIFIIVTWAASVAFPNINAVLSILGGLCAATLDYGIPTFCYVKLSTKPWTHPKNLGAIIFFGALVAVGYSSVVVTIWYMVVKCPSYSAYAQNDFQPNCPPPKWQSG